MALNEMLQVGLVTVSLAGCAAAEGFGNRYGPDPAMPVRQIEASVDHQVDIMAKLKSAASCPAEMVHSPDCNYATTLVGFNFVDEQCDAYLHELFALDKERERAKDAVVAAGTLTSAILGVSNASKATMVIAAQAFGLSASYIDVFADSYLYKTDTGVIYSVVEKLQTEYRKGAYEDFKNNRNLYATDPQVYGSIRGYLRLCMPPTIQSKITTAIASAKAVQGSGTAPNAFKSVDLSVPGK